MNQKKTSFHVLGWTICCIAALYYCYAFILRVFPSVMKSGLSQVFHFDATTFGLMATFYYIAYIPMQLVVGIIVDRFGAKIVLSLACLIATLGVFMFIVSKNIQSLEYARFMMGLGSAFGYVTVLKLASLWLPPNRFAIMAGLTTGLGMWAAISSLFIFTKTIQTLGFRHLLMFLLVIGIILFVIILLTVKSHPPKDKNTSTIEIITFVQIFKQLWSMLFKPQMWLIGTIGLVLYLPSSVFLDLWGLPYLRVVDHLTMYQANISILMIFLGWSISSPIIGAISDSIKRRKLPLFVCSLGATISMCIIFYVPDLALVPIDILFFCFGVFCGVHPLCFALSKENNSKLFAGSAIALTNAFIMLGGLLQLAVGKLLDFDWHGTYTAQHLKLYTSSDYIFALSILPIGLGIATILSLMLKETYCQEYTSSD